MIRRISAAVLRLEWLFLLLVLPVTFFSPGRQTAVLLLLPLLWLLRRLATGHFVPPTPYNAAILALATMLLVSLYATFDIWLSMPRITGLVVGIFLFFGAVAFSRFRPANLWLLLAFFLAAVAGMAALGVMGVQWSGPFAVLRRAQTLLPLAGTGIFGANDSINPNFLAGALVWGAPLALALLFGLAGTLWRGPFWQKLLLPVLAGLFLLFTGLIVASQSRGGMLSLGTAVFLMLAVRYRWGRWLLLLLVPVGIALAYYFGLGTLFVSSETLGEYGLSGRLEIWSRAIYGLQDFPFTGMSMNGFRRVVHILYPLFLISPTSDIGHAHNHLLQAGLDLGLPGLVAYLALWLLSVGLLWRAWQAGPTAAQRALLLGLSGSLAAGWTFGAFDAIGLGERPGFLLWLMLALIVGAFEAVRRQNALLMPAAETADNDSAPAA
jgi:putative inorganic carbon (hco3(-)) transporter